MSEQYATQAYLLRRVPETAAVLALDADALTDALSDAEPMIGLSAYGKLAELAHAYYAAHLLAFRFASTMGGEQGPITGKSAGEVSVTYGGTGTVVGTGGKPATTRWGRLFLEQQRLAGASLRVVG